MGLIWLPLAWLIGGIACTSPLLALVAVGWVARFSVRRWGDPWPGWVLGSGPGLLSRVFGGLWANLRMGLVQVLGTGLLLGPVTLCWAFGWRFGWDVSFYKAYDAFGIGPGLGLFGLLLFGVLMVVVPLAQARHAETGDWRAFTELPSLWQMAWQRPVEALLLAGAHALVGIPVMVMWMVPVFVGRNQPYEAWTVSEQLAWLQRFGFVSAMVFFPAFVCLRVVAVRWYRRGLEGAMGAGRIRKDQLLAGEAVQQRPRAWIRGGLALAPFRSAFLVATVLVWVLAGSQLFVANFFHYRPLMGWNVPLVQLPVFTYVPEHLR